MYTLLYISFESRIQLFRFFSAFPGFIQVHILKRFITFLPNMRKRLDSFKKSQKIKIVSERISPKQMALIYLSSHSAFFEMV